MDPGLGEAAPEGDSAPAASIFLSVVVPVFNLEGSIVSNVKVIHDRVSAAVSGPIEVLVISDGSVDQTEERLLESDLSDVRIVHYDRNLGKGYAVKVGALEARGRWIGYVDADLDLDPAALPEYVVVAERDGLDFAIGSKRHPDSRVDYPKSRRVASWLFQQLVRLLFRLDVRDTQVGLKVFRREIAEQVMPLLLVKRYAFDIELLAVSRAFGFSRVREMPIVLDYKFTGSGVRAAGVTYALVDVLAVFYRLRILRYYQRRRALGGAFAWTRPGRYHPVVTVVSEDLEIGARLDYDNVEQLALDVDDPVARRAAAEQADGEIVAFLERDARPSGNWLSATVPFFARAEVDAVVTPRVAPAQGSARELAAAAISESLLGGGSLHFRFTPGNIRYVSDFPARSFLVRRERLLTLNPATPLEEVVLEIAADGGSVIYLPEASVTARQEPLFVPHARRIASYGRARGALVRHRGRPAARLSSVAALALFLYGVAGWILVLGGATEAYLWLGGWLAYGALVLVVGGLGGLRFRSVAVAGLTCVGLVVTHVVYATSFVVGLAKG